MLNVSFSGMNTGTRKPSTINPQGAQPRPALSTPQPRFQGNSFTDMAGQLLQFFKEPSPEFYLFNYHQGDPALEELLMPILKQGPEAHEALFRLFRDGITGKRLKAFAALEEIGNNPQKLRDAAMDDTQRARLAQKAQIQQEEPDFEVIA